MKVTNGTPPVPKKPPCIFIMFRSQVIPLLKKEYQKLSPSALSQKSSYMFRTLGETDLNELKRKYKLAKEIHELELQDYISKYGKPAKRKNKPRKHKNEKKPEKVKEIEKPQINNTDKINEMNQDKTKNEIKEAIFQVDNSKVVQKSFENKCFGTDDRESE